MATPQGDQPPSVAGIRIDTPLPHLDRPFDYAIPPGLAAQVAFGSRVRVRFSGRLCTGLVVEVGHQAEHGRALRPIERVLGPEPVLLPEILSLAESVAERMAGTVRDVLRAAIPPRHARAEAAVPVQEAVAAEALNDPTGPWQRYRHGPALIRRLAQHRGGPALRACWSAAPGGTWPEELAALIGAACQGQSGGVIAVVPDAWDVERARSAAAHLGLSVAILTADLGPQRRYVEFLRILRGQARVVIGTRAAVFAPMRDCRAIIVWQDGDEALWDPQAPYWNARDVAALRSHQTGCGLLVGSVSRSVQVQAWVEQGWMRSVDPLRSVIRATGPIIRGLDESAEGPAARARIPHLAWQVAKEGLRTGPVLIQVPRRGYLPALACQECRQPARCECQGPLALGGGSAVPQCGWCGRLAGDWRCPACRSTGLRAVRIGVERTAEEFGRAFPGSRVIWSAGDRQHRTVGAGAALVVATFGSEPIADGGYAAVVILDARSLLLRTGLRATEEVAERWFAAASLARARAHVVVTADHGAPAVQALLRWDAGWLAARDLQDRREAGLPPATRLAVLTGPPSELTGLAQDLPVPHRSLGPTGDRLILVVDRADGLSLAQYLRARLVARSSRGATGVRIMLDPREV